MSAIRGTLCVLGVTRFVTSSFGWDMAVSGQPDGVSIGFLRLLYGFGLELAEGEYATFGVRSSASHAIHLRIRNAHDGFVEVLCSDARLTAELSKFVGLHVVMCSDEELARPSRDQSM